MAIKTDTFEVITVNYKGKIFPADDFRGILSLRISEWPKKFKVWRVLRFSDNKQFQVYDLVGGSNPYAAATRRITQFNTGNVYDEAWVYFDDGQAPEKLTELR